MEYLIAFFPLMQFYWNKFFEHYVNGTGFTLGVIMTAAFVIKCVGIFQEMMVAKKHPRPLPPPTQQPPQQPQPPPQLPQPPLPPLPPLSPPMPKIFPPYYYYYGAPITTGIPAGNASFNFS